MNSNLPDDWQIFDKQFDKQYLTTFSQKVTPMKYPVQTCMLVRTWTLLFMYFPGISHETIKSILNGKRTLSNLIQVISSYNICPGIKSQQAKKTHLSFSTKNLRFFSESYFLPFNFMCAFTR